MSRHATRAAAVACTVLVLLAGCSARRAPRLVTPSASATFDASARPLPFQSPSPAASPSVSATPSVAASPGATPRPTRSPSTKPASLPTRMVLPAHRRSISTSFDVSAAGSTLTGYVSVSISHDVGTVTIGGKRLPALSYQEQPWPAFNLTLYQTLAIDSQGIYVMWIYCSGGAITYMYWESTAKGVLEDGAATGTCKRNGGSAKPTVSFPALDVPAPKPQGGYRVTGPDIKLDGAKPGTIRLGGVMASLYVFSIVDCSTACGQVKGWYELHSVALTTDGRVIVGILYLQLSDRSYVDFQYGLSLPDLSYVYAFTLNANWSV